MSAPARAGAGAAARDWLQEVAAQLPDLPDDARSGLLEDLTLHLDALAADDDGRPVAVRLGSPAAYAAELRAAAGLPVRPPGTDQPAPARAGLGDRLAGLLATRGVREVGRLVGELRPSWWLLRGYLAVLVPYLLLSGGPSDLLVPSPGGSRVVGVLLVLAAVAGSVALGRRSLPRVPGVLVGVAGVVLALAAVAVVLPRVEAVLARGTAEPVSSPLPEQALGEYPLLSRSGPVTDVLPYAADGTPLEGVLLYDQDGRPLRVGFQEWWADGCARVLQQPRAADGVPVPHSFPQSYELDPAGLRTSGAPAPGGTCTADVARPSVPLPKLPAPLPSATVGVVPGG